MQARQPLRSVVDVLRASPEELATNPRDAVLAELEAARAERRALDDQLRAIDRRIASLRSKSELLRMVPAPGPAEELSNLRVAIHAALENDLAEIRRRSDALVARAHARTRPDPVADRQRDVREEAEGLSRADLDGQPAGYARAVAERRSRLERRLRPFATEPEDAASDALDAAPREVAVLAALDPPQGPPTALQLVVPVPPEVHSSWRDWGDSLCARLAWRVMAALSVALRDSGAADAPIRSTRSGACLAFQVWLGDSNVTGNPKDALARSFDRLHEEGAELRDAGLDLFFAWVEPEVLTIGGAS